MLNNFNEEARKILLSANNEMKQLKHPYIGSEHLLLAILKSKNKVSDKLKEYGLTYDSFKNELVNIVGMGSKESEWILYTPLLKRVLENALIDSKEDNSKEVTINHLFSSLLEEGEGVAIRIMMSLDIDVDQLYDDFSNRIITPKNSKLLIEELGIDLTKKARENKVDPVLGRDIEINQVLEILLRRNKNNPILIGEAGVGKTAIVEGISQLIALDKVPEQLKNKKIISLDMASSVAGTKYRGEFEERIKKILKEVEENEDIILFIDEIHTLMGAGGAEGAIDAANIFKPALARNTLRCIGATTIDEYKKTFEKDAALERRFQKILVSEPSKEQTKEIIYKLKPIYEHYHQVRISNQILNLIIELANKYIKDRKNPDKTIDILDEVCAKVSLKESDDIKKHHKLRQQVITIMNQKNTAIMKNDFKLASQLKEKENILTNEINTLEIKIMSKPNKKSVTKKDLFEVIINKTGIPIDQSRSKLSLKIKNELKKQVVGQEQALEKIVEAIKNNSSSLLIYGCEGIGKTKISKILADIYSKNVIKIEMSEYKESHAITKLIGTSAGYVGYEDNHNILDKIRSNPYTTIILESIEKAHPSVLNLFETAIEDKKIVDGKGKTIDLSNVLIIMTSTIKKSEIGFNSNNSTLLDDFLTPGIKNKIDAMIELKPLDQKDIEKIIKNKVNLKPEIVQKIIAESHYLESGAHSIDKLISKYKGQKEKVFNL